MNRIHDLWRAIRPGAFDATDHGARAAERHRRIGWSILLSASARGSSILMILLTTPVLLAHLGSERFGVWATISALGILLSFTDFGVGNSLITLTAKNSLAERTDSLRQVVSTAYIVSLGFSGALLIVTALLYSRVNWAEFFNVAQPASVRDVGQAVAVLFTVLIISSPVGLAYRVQQGLQQGYRAGGWQAVGSFVTLAALLGAVGLDARLPVLVAVAMGVPLLFGVGNTLAFFLWVRPDLRPGWSGWRMNHAKGFGSSGAMYFLLQMLAAAIFQVNPIIISRVLGAGSVPIYSVPERMFTLITVCVGFVSAPLWPAFSEAWEHGDVAWVRRTFSRYAVALVAIAVASSASLWLAGPLLLRLWVGHSIAVPDAMLIGLAVWKVLETAGVVLSVLLNGLHKIVIQVVGSSLTLAAAVPLSVLLTRHYGPQGAIWGTIISYACISVPIYCVGARLALRFHRVAERDVARA